MHKKTPKRRCLQKEASFLFKKGMLYCSLRKVTEDNGMKLSFTIRLKAKDLFFFNMKQTYSGFNGWLSILLGLVFFWMAYSQGPTAGAAYVILYIAAGILILAYNPLTLWTRAKRVTGKDPVLSQPLGYEISADGIHVTQQEAEAMLPWDQVYKMVEDKKQVRIYSSRINAYIIPLDQLEEAKLKALRTCAKTCLPDYRRHMKK